MKLPYIVAASLGMAIAISGTSAISAKTTTGIMTEHSNNPFAQALAVAAQQRSEMRGQRHELKPLVEMLFAGQSTAAFAEFLAETVIRDKAFRAVKLNVDAIRDGLAKGEKIAIDFTPEQIRAITGQSGAFLEDDIVVLSFSSERTTGSVKIDAAAILNTTIYP